MTRACRTCWCRSIRRGDCRGIAIRMRAPRMPWPSRLRLRFEACARARQRLPIAEVRHYYLLASRARNLHTDRRSHHQICAAMLAVQQLPHALSPPPGKSKRRLDGSFDLALDPDRFIRAGTRRAGLWAADDRQLLDTAARQHLEHAGRHAAGAVELR